MSSSRAAKSRRKTLSSQQDVALTEEKTMISPKAADPVRTEETFRSLFGVQKQNARREPVGSYFRLVAGTLKAGMVAVVEPAEFYWRDAVLLIRRKAGAKSQSWHVLSFGPKKPGGRNWLIGERIT